MLAGVEIVKSGAKPVHVPMAGLPRVSTNARLRDQNEKNRPTPLMNLWPRCGYGRGHSRGASVDGLSPVLRLAPDERFPSLFRLEPPRAGVVTEEGDREKVSIQPLRRTCYKLRACTRVPAAC